MSDIYYAVAHRPQTEIDTFKTRYEDFPALLIPEIFKTTMDLTVTTWRPSDSWGTSHVIYYVKTKELDRELILRANLGVSAPEAAMEIEKLVTDEVLKLGLKTNQILHADITRTRFPFDYQIEEVLEGEDPENHWTGTQAEYDQVSFDLGVYVATYHQLQFPGFGLFDAQSAQQGQLRGSKTSFFEYLTTCLESDLAKLKEFHVLNRNQVEGVKKVFIEREQLVNSTPCVLIHHDLADHNLLCVNNKLSGVFDWETCGVGDPVLDLASCPTWRTHHPREEKLLEGYQTISKLPTDFNDRRDLYRLRTMLWKMVFAIRAGILNEDRKKKFYTALEPFSLI
ncbi:MAG TPA: aminoglycoside phosphotransferase family protein [Vitreimonas sp.]|nr:aminoglycoside phosphotransferase family protein [Vitreimonas sp.]